MNSNDKKTTAIIVLFVVVHLLAFTSILDVFVLYFFESKTYSDYSHLNMSLISNYSLTLRLDLELSGFAYCMIHLFFAAVDILPTFGGIIGTLKGKRGMAKASIIIMDVVCALTLLSRFTGWGTMKNWLYEGTKLSNDMVVILGCVIALNVLIFTLQPVTQTMLRPYAPAQSNHWYCHICGTENNLSNTCVRCGGRRADASPVSYSKPANAAPVPPTPTPETKSASKFDEIKAYKDLLDSGAITQEEFDKLKAEILGF